MEFISFLAYSAISETFSNDALPLSLESGSLDRLMEKVRYTSVEMAEANHLSIPDYLHFRVDLREKVG